MSFREVVLKYIAKVPRGRVVSYGQVASLAGSPRAARQVGGILRGLPLNSGIPWWRVVNGEGYISIKNNFEASKELQKGLLMAEGIPVGEDYKLDILKYRHNF